MAAIPTTPQKGGRALQHLVTEATRFVMSAQHKELELRSDREPSILAVVGRVPKACRNLGVVIHDEGAPAKNHQSNGAAEVTAQVLRSKAGLLIQQMKTRLLVDVCFLGAITPCTLGP